MAMSVALNLERVRKLAREEGLTEVYFNEDSRVVSFVKQYVNGEDSARINVYWTTGTVGTCLNHPRQGRTQLFRRNMDLKSLAQIFRNPRIHTGEGYHRREHLLSNSNKRQRTSQGYQIANFSFSVGDRAHVIGYDDCTLRSGILTSGAYAGKVLVEYDGGQTYHVSPDQLTEGLPRIVDEVTDAKAQLKRLLEQVQLLQSEIKVVGDILEDFERKRREKAEAEAAEKARQEEEKRLEMERQEEEKRLEMERQKEVERASRGSRMIFAHENAQSIQSNFNKTVTCISCGGKATIMLYENERPSWTAGIPSLLYKKLNGRQKSLPNPDYVAIGSQDRYYVRFSDGSAQWVGCDQMTKELKEEKRRVKTVAFGEFWDSYFIVFDDGWWSYMNIPAALVKLITSRNKRDDLTCVSLGPKGEYYMRARNGRAWWGNLESNNMASISKVKDCVQFMDFGDGDNFLCRHT